LQCPLDDFTFKVYERTAPPINPIKQQPCAKGGSQKSTSTPARTLQEAPVSFQRTRLEQVHAAPSQTSRGNARDCTLGCLSLHDWHWHSSMALNKRLFQTCISKLVRLRPATVYSFSFYPYIAERFSTMHVFCGGFTLYPIGM